MLRTFRLSLQLLNADGAYVLNSSVLMVTKQCPRGTDFVVLLMVQFSTTVIYTVSKVKREYIIVRCAVVS